MTEIDNSARIEAYNLAREASRKLDEAARKLGYEDVHQLASASYDGEVPAEMDHGVKAVTNAHSYLNNGDLEHLHPDHERF